MENVSRRGPAIIERVASSEARERLTELMNRARFAGECFVLTRNGEDIAVIIGSPDYERLVGTGAAA